MEIGDRFDLTFEISCTDKPEHNRTFVVRAKISMVKTTNTLVVRYDYEQPLTVCRFCRVKPAWIGVFPP